MQAVSVQGANYATQAVVGVPTENQRTQQQLKTSGQLGVRFSAYNGVPVRALARRCSESKKASKRSTLVTAGLKDAIDLITKPLNPFGSGEDDDDDDVVEITGQLIISKKSIFDFVNIPAQVIDDQFDLLFNQLVNIQLVSVEHKPGKPDEPKISKKSNIEKWISSTGLKDKIVAGDDAYAVKFKVEKDFGEIGAFTIRNNHPSEFFLHSLTLEVQDGPVYCFPCNSWVYNDSIYPTDRVFFSNKTYLPGSTPSGLKVYRDQELQLLRGNGKGVRKVSDRIYDYDVYNDLGAPDLGIKRPVLGGSKNFPYPRRCRTGRRKAFSDSLSETHAPSGNALYYIPVDDSFSRDKNSGFFAGALKGFGHAVLPILTGLFDGTPDTWDNFEEIMTIYDKGINVQQDLNKTDDDDKKSSLVFLSTIFKAEGENKSVLKYPKPQVVKADDMAWMTDEEFGRQALAGMNPCVITAVEEFPPKSTLDSSIYGPATSLTANDIDPYLEGLSVKQAIRNKRLFVVDYRDIFLPYIAGINATGFKAYAPRTYFFLTSENKMKPVAIELSLPPTPEGPASNRVFTPPMRTEDTNILWDLAKLHSSTIDFSFHEVVSHWLRTHAVIEPFIIATHRHLSKLHPLHTLLLPLFKNTMMINSAAREILISGKGIIELMMTPGEKAMEISSNYYKSLWRFDHQALPQDLIARGMAEPANKSHPGGVKLVVDDYPFAKDGLELWDAIHGWMSKYLNIVYKSDREVKNDTEVQAWWEEVVNVGHGDLKDAPWWPKADSIKNLTEICVTIAWMAGPHHAAVNFGQYAYAGYMPNKPPSLRKLIPTPGTAQYEEMLQDPEKFKMKLLSSQTATSIIGTTVEILSSHSVDEEYQGMRLEDNWTSDPEIQAAFQQFSNEIAALQARFEERNGDPNLHHRKGPAQVLYTLLHPNSPTSGQTGSGVPYSVCI